MAIGRYVKLNTGYMMPSLGFGTYLLLNTKLQESLDYALHLGYRHIDTALSYGNESIIGEVIRDRINSGKLKRKDLFITTKVPPVFLGRENVKRSLDFSLERLKMTYVDLYLIHKPFGKRYHSDDELYPVDKEGNPDHYHYDLNSTWEAMEECAKNQMCKSIGVSNFAPSQINRILTKARYPISNLQLECHVYLQQNQLRRLCNEQNIVVTAYAPLGAPGRPDNLRTPKDHVALEDELVGKICMKMNKSPSQILLRYLVELGVVPLPKSETKTRIKENFSVFDFELCKDDIESIAKLDRNEKYFKFLRDKDNPEYPNSESF